MTEAVESSVRFLAQVNQVRLRPSGGGSEEKSDRAIVYCGYDCQGNRHGTTTLSKE